MGTGDSEGITLYMDGTEGANDTIKSGESYLPGDGRIVVGRFLTDVDDHYNSLEVDELIFFNSALVLNDIVALATTM